MLGCLLYDGRSPSCVHVVVVFPNIKPRGCFLNIYVRNIMKRMGSSVERMIRKKKAASPALYFVPRKAKQDTKLIALFNETPSRRELRKMHVLL